ncbi:ABC transporter permease [Pelomonas sp. KK5]|uniref:ABC transporter permease n=1 Tax=Pelomonas sp. KK5 TaxID=1855730 RepID=UPI00097C8B5B|nr:FtsX-like permease family protein [Pelomonas sp. KK5]
MTSSTAIRHRPPSVFQMAWRQLWRDWRSGELRLLILAVSLAVAALCAVSFLSDRLDQGLRRDAAALLGGDALVASDQPTPAPLAELATRLGLQQMRSVTFPSMARATDAQGGASRLVMIKAVDAAYPLRGRMVLADGRTAGAPKAGEVWADAAVLDGLGLKAGDPLLLGDATLKIGGIIATEPDRGAGFASFAPRVMLNNADLAATALVQPASRVTYRLAVAAPAGQAARVGQFVTEAKATIEGQGARGVRLESLENGRPEMRQTLDRATKFLRLVAMLSALLAAVAVALSARDFASRHLDDCAMLRVLGQPQRRIAWAYSLEFGAAGLTASLIGVLLGLALHYVFLGLLSGLVTVDLPAPGFWPALLGIGLGLALLAGFGLPPVLQLASVPALRVIRRDLGGLKAGSLLVLASGVIGFALILLALAGEPALGLIASAGFGAALGLFALLAWLAVLLLRRLVPQAGAPRWLLLATRQMASRPAFAVVQVASLAVGLLALALLVLLRTDLIDSWRKATPENAPNRFVINIQPDQGEAFRGKLDAAGVKGYDWYPMIRGRLVAINGAEVKPGAYKDERARALIDREFNLSHSATLPDHNLLVGGQWTEEEKDGISIEAGLADTLKLKLGDVLRFDVAGQLIESRITSLRKVDWASMRVNFYALYPRAEMPELPSTFITAFKAPPPVAGLNSLDRDLSHDFPNLTVVDVSAQLNQIQKVVDQVIQAVQFLFAFTLATGLVVLLASVASTRDARTREFALMRAFGAGSKLLAQVQRAELLGVGALAGFLAGGVAIVLAGLLTRYVFDFSWQPDPWVPLFAAVAGALLAQAAGWWSLRGVLRRPVVQTLREANVE